MSRAIKYYKVYSVYRVNRCNVNGIQYSLQIVSQHLLQFRGLIDTQCRQWHLSIRSKGAFSALGRASPVYLCLKMCQRLTVKIARALLDKQFTRGGVCQGHPLANSHLPINQIRLILVQPRGSSNLEQCIEILGNVPVIDAKVDTDLLQYAVRPFLLNSLWFGLPQNRERVYIGGVRTGDGELGLHEADYLELVTTYLKLLYLKPPPPEPKLHDHVRETAKTIERLMLRHCDMI